MKGMKKLLSILMVLTLVLSLGAMAFADDGGTKVTVEGPDGHTYAAYQVFTGTTATIEGKGEVLAAIEWANPTGADDLLGYLKSDPTIGSFFREQDLTTATKAAEIMGQLTTTAQKQALARVLLAHKDLLVGPTTIEDGVTVLDPGYYVIEDTTDVDGIQDAKNEIILEVVGDEVTVDEKHDVPESQKKVQEKNDTDGTTSDWQDGADWDIGDDVPFQFVGTLPDNLDSYTTYKMVFHDKQSDGLTFYEDSVHVYLGTKGADGKYIKGEEVNSSGYTVNFPSLTSGETFDVTINDVKTLSPAPTKDNVIIVEYTSELNDKAVIGGIGNPNTMYMEFSNNPGGEGTGKTPDDKVTVFTFKMDVNKVDEDQEELKGAGFTLLKKVPASASTSFTDVAKWEDLGKQPKDTYVRYNGETYIVAFEQITGVTTFTFTGLDSGNYLLVETTVPNGYNRADDIELTVEATYDTDSVDPKLTGLTVTPPEAEFTAEATTGTISGDVVNQSGLTLPETGGIGTTIFYIAGAVLVIGAMILLVTKKRVSGMEK